MNRTVSSFCDACRDSVVWSRTLRIGLPVGLLQVAINQGEFWLFGAVTAGVVAKSILSPAVSCAIAFSAAASARRSVI
jgi:hypothetical protein